MYRIKVIIFVVASIFVMNLVPVQAQQQQKAEWGKLFQQIDELYKAGKYNDAVSRIREGLEILEKQVKSGDFDKDEASHHFVMLNKKMELVCEANLAAKEKSLGPDHPDVAKDAADLAMFYMVHRQFGKAEQFFKKTLAIQEKSLGLDHPTLVNTLFNLAVLHYMQNQYDEAAPFVEKALVLRKKSSKPDFPDIIEGLKSIADIYRDTGHPQRAEALEEHFEKIRNTRQ